MFTLRIRTIASLVDKNSIVLDVGTDHAYLPIYLISNKISKKVIACDISKKVLEIAKKNVEKYKLDSKIKVCLSDGVNSVSDNYDTLVIAGMGFSTIKKILDNNSELDKKTIIIQTNSEHDNLRLYMNKKGFKIDQEITLKDKKIYYVIIKYVKGEEVLSKSEILFGKSNNVDYLNYLVDKNKSILKNVPFRTKFRFMYQNYLIKKLLKKNRVITCKR